MRASGQSAADKSAVTAACQQLIDGFLKPRFLPIIRPTQFNYPVDILGKWHGTKYRFIQRYRSGFPENIGEEFDAPFARLDWISRNRFDIRWHVTPENGSACIAASPSPKRSTPSDPTDCSIHLKPRSSAGSRTRDTRRMDTFQHRHTNAQCAFSLVIKDTVQPDRRRP
jgi:hypothetical protein